MNRFINNLTTKNEEIQLTLYRQWLSQLLKFILPLAIIGVDLFFTWWWLSYGFWGIIVFGVIFTIALFCLIRAIYILRRYVTVITDKRIIHNQQLGFFNKTLRECFFDKIEEISYNKKGIFATLFNYGSLQIKTASESTGLILDRLSQPAKIKEEIINLQQAYVPVKPAVLLEKDEGLIFTEANVNEEKEEELLSENRLIKPGGKQDKENDKIDWGTF